MNVMYCVKCKSKTGTAQLQKFQTKNNKLMIGGTCVKCGIRKTQFISPEQAKKGGFVFTLPMLAAAAGIAASAATAGSTIANAVNSKKAKDKELAETKRHNMAMETKGKGLFLKPYRSTIGGDLRSYRKGGNLGTLFTAASRKIIQSQKQKKGKGLFLKTL